MITARTALCEEVVETTGGLSPDRLAALLPLVDDGAISGAAGKQVFETVYRTGQAPGQVVEALGLAQVSDSSELERMVVEVLDAQPQAVGDYRAGKNGAINFLAGQVMKASRGKANPQQVNELLKTKIG